MNRAQHVIPAAADRLGCFVACRVASSVRRTRTMGRHDMVLRIERIAGGACRTRYVVRPQSWRRRCPAGLGEARAAVRRGECATVAERQSLIDSPRHETGKTRALMNGAPDDGGV